MKLFSGWSIRNLEISLGRILEFMSDLAVLLRRNAEWLRGITKEKRVYKLRIFTVVQIVFSEIPQTNIQLLNMTSISMSPVPSFGTTNVHEATLGIRERSFNP